MAIEVFSYSKTIFCMSFHPNMQTLKPHIKQKSILRRLNRP